jgi:folate-binding protein YgfZ
MNEMHNFRASWTMLEESQLLFVKGPDAAKFLQGQVTCDVRDLNNGTTCIGAQCNPKGRILLTFRALQMDPETIALRIPTAMRDKAQQSLGKYIVFSKAKLIDGQDEFRLFGLYGEDAHRLAGKIFPELPEQTGEFKSSAGNFIIRLDANRYECWISSPQRDEIAQQLTSMSAQGSTNDWLLLDIQNGLANVFPETWEIFTPQEINYQLINGVNFRKGCYTGQEIVARLHYRGKLKRHMYRLGVFTNELPAPGEQISNMTNNQTAGQVVMAAWKTKGEAEILASVIDEHLDGLALTHNQQKLSLLSLPYAIPTADEKNE